MRYENVLEDGKYSRTRENDLLNDITTKFMTNESKRTFYDIGLESC